MSGEATRDGADIEAQRLRLKALKAELGLSRLRGEVAAALNVIGEVEGERLAAGCVPARVLEARDRLRAALTEEDGPCR